MSFSNHEKALYMFVVTYKGREHVFDLIFHTRNNPLDFVFSYLEDLYPEDGSIEIEVSKHPEWIGDNLPETTMFVTSKKSRLLTRYLSIYPASNIAEAKYVAEEWAKVCVICPKKKRRKSESLDHYLDKPVEIVWIS